MEKQKMNNEIQKVGLEAFNELAESHEAHVRQIAKLEKELKQYKQLDYDNLTLVTPDGELLLECKLGDKYHRALLELGMTKLLKEHLKDNKNETTSNNKR